MPEESRLDDAAHVNFYEEEKKARKPFRATYAITVEIDLQFKRQDQLMEGIIDALRNSGIQTISIRQLGK